MDLHDGHMIEITCPHCKSSINQTYRWFKQEIRSCPECDDKFNADVFKREIKEIERKLSEVKKKIDKMKE